MTMEQLKINGVEKQFEQGIPATVAALLDELGFDSATVVAEVDGEIIKRDDFAATNLKKGQNIELLRFVGGG
jgi:sulfur carrier protein